ncbi:hypothetical protein BZG36_03899 [Bifiguratus adelaidae]|uniref:SANT domain-containing protein n=1 Tax=Bifiguratus adelaidae TaxID=1938954 RepID=A0A261XXP2_9FUNG|nr:hypothetical protein BZG36_03899 [Bifiguratus adelaidae]
MRTVFQANTLIIPLTSTHAPRLTTIDMDEPGNRHHCIVVKRTRKSIIQTHRGTVSTDKQGPDSIPNLVQGELPSKRELDNTINQKNPGNGVEKNALSAKVTIDRVEPGTNPQIAYTSPESSNTGIKSDTPTNPEVEQVTSLSRPLVSVKEDNVSNGLLHDKHSFAAEHDIEQELQSIDVQIAHYDDVLRLADKEKPPDPLSIEQDALEKEVHEDIANTPEFSQDYGSTSAIKAEDVEVIKQEQPGAVNNSTEGLSTYPISRGNDKGSDGVVQQRDLEISKMEISDIYQNNHRLAARYGRLRCRLPKGFTIENHDGINSLSSNNLISVIHEEHVKSFRMFKPTLVNFLAKHALDLAVKEDDLRKEYKGFWDAWNERNRALDKKKEKERKANAKLSAGTKRKAEDGEVDGYFDPLFDDWSAEPGAPLATPGYLGSSRSSGRRGLYQSDAVRSEAELMEIIRSLETQEMRNPEMRAAKTTANIPSMIMDPYERFRFRFHSTNNYIEDPYNYYHCGEEPDVWSEEERAVFIRKYLAYPKQFGKIASFLPRKTATQCVLHYYRIKKELDVKGLLNSRGGKRKAKGLPGRKKEKVQPLTASGTSQKSKGSSLLSDIGQAQKSFKQGSPDEGEKKPRELRDLEAANASWKAVNERRQRKPTGTMERPYSEYEEAFPSKDAIGIRLDSTSEKKRKIATKPKGRLKGDADLGSPMSMSDATSLTLDTTTQNAEKGTASTTRWTVHDRRRAVAAFQKFGPDFEAVAEAMGTKTELQCKKFYIRYTKKHGPQSLSARATPDTAADQQESSVHRIDLTKLITNPGNLETPTPSDYALSSEALRAGNVSPRDHPDFGAEEEDAAAALVGMFQMAGPSTVNDQRQQLTNNAIKSNLLRKRHGDNATPELRSPLVPLQTSSLSAAHPSTVNTYWSQAEQDACAGMLREYGPDFRRISYLLQSKTAEQIRAFYEANTQYFRSHDAGSFAPKPDSFVTGRPVGSHQHPAPLDSRYPYAHTPSALDSRRDVEGTYYAEQPNQSMSLPKHASSHGGGDGASQERPSIPRGSSILDLLNEPSPTQDHGHSRRDSAQNADNKSTSTSHIQQHYPPPQPSSPYEYDRSHPAQSGSSPAPHYRTSQGELGTRCRHAVMPQSKLKEKGGGVGKITTKQKPSEKAGVKGKARSSQDDEALIADAGQSDKGTGKPRRSKQDDLEGLQITFYEIESWIEKTTPILTRMTKELDKAALQIEEHRDHNSVRKPYSSLPHHLTAYPSPMPDGHSSASSPTTARSYDRSFTSAHHLNISPSLPTTSTANRIPDEEVQWNISYKPSGGLQLQTNITYIDQLVEAVEKFSILAGPSVYGGSEPHTIHSTGTSYDSVRNGDAGEALPPGSPKDDDDDDDDDHLEFWNAALQRRPHDPSRFPTDGLTTDLGQIPPEILNRIFATYSDCMHPKVFSNLGMFWNRYPDQPDKNQLCISSSLALAFVHFMRHDNQTFPETRGLGHLFATRSRAILDVMDESWLDVPDFPMVEALANMGMFQSFIKNISQARIYIGLASRMIMEMGVHRMENLPTDVQERKHRIRVLMVLYYQDLLCSMYSTENTILEDEEMNVDFREFLCDWAQSDENGAAQEDIDEHTAMQRERELFFVKQTLLLKIGKQIDRIGVYGKAKGAEANKRKIAQMKADVELALREWYSENLEYLRAGSKNVNLQMDDSAHTPILEPGSSSPNTSSKTTPTSTPPPLSASTARISSLPNPPIVSEAVQSVRGQAALLLLIQYDAMWIRLHKLYLPAIHKVISLFAASGPESPSVPYLASKDDKSFSRSVGICTLAAERVVHNAEILNEHYGWCTFQQFIACMYQACTIHCRNLLVGTLDQVVTAKQNIERIISVLESSVTQYHGLPEDLVHCLHEFCREHESGYVDEHNTFCKEQNLMDYVEDFRKGALVAQHPEAFEEIPELTEEDKYYLRRELTNKWDQPKQLYYLVLLVSMCAVVQGMDEAVVNGAQIFYSRQFGLDGNDSTSQWIIGLVNSAPYLCCATIGCWLTDPLNRWWGRRGVIFASVIIAALASIWEAVSPSWPVLFAARFVLGLGIGPKSTTSPVYSAECTPPAIRGALVMMWQMWTAFGIALGDIINVAFYFVPDSSGIVGLNWRLMLGSTVVAPLIVAAQVYFCPESPRWYISKGRVDKAFESFQRLRHTNLLAARDLYYAYTLIQAENELKKSRNLVAELFTVPRNARAALAAWIVMFMQQFCGINVFAYYSSQIFVGGHFTEVAALLASMGFGILNWLFALPAVWSIDTFGRRNLLLTTFPLMSIFLLFTGFCFWIPDSSPAHVGLIVLGIYIFTIFYSVGEGPVPFTYSAEVFPLYVVTLGLSLEELDHVFSVPTSVHAKWGLRQIPYFISRHIFRRKKEPENLFDYAGMPRPQEDAIEDEKRRLSVGKV